MSRGEKTAVMVALAVAGVFLALGFTESGQGVKADVQGDLELGAGGDYDDRSHICQPSDMARRIVGRHPLYTRPERAGQARALLAAGGWPWYLNPPSEV